MRAALYARVSTDRQAQDDRNSLPVQRARFADWCQQHDAEPAAEYIDTETGRRVSRTGYQAMLRDARGGKLDTIVVRHLDRFGRDQWEIMARIGELRSNGVEVAATDEALHDFIYIALSAWKADAESKRLGERVRSALTRQASLGRKTGKPAYGYRYVDGKLAIDKTRAAVVRRIYRYLLEENMGARAIAIRLNREGIAPPVAQAWNHNTIRKLLRRPVYAGDLVYAEITARDAHPAIVDRDTWDRAQDRLNRMRTLPGGRTQSSINLLAGIARCGYCGGGMQSVKTRQGKRRYACNRKYRTDDCETWNRHPADTLERDVLDAMATQAVDRQHGPDPAARAQQDLDERTATVDALDSELRQNLDLYRQDALTLDQLRIANAGIHERRELAEAARQAAEHAYEHASTTQEHRPDPATLRATIDALPPAQAKALLQEVIDRITVWEDRVEVTLR